MGVTGDPTGAAARFGDADGDADGDTVATTSLAFNPQEYNSGAPATTPESGMKGKVVVAIVMTPFSTFSKSIA